MVVIFRDPSTRRPGAWGGTVGVGLLGLGMAGCDTRVLPIDLADCQCRVWLEPQRVEDAWRCEDGVLYWRVEGQWQAFWTDRYMTMADRIGSVACEPLEPQP